MENSLIGFLVSTLFGKSDFQIRLNTAGDVDTPAQTNTEFEGTKKVGSLHRDF